MLAPEASIEMLQAGVNHLAVVDADGNVLGVVSAGSLMNLDAISPFALRWTHLDGARRGRAGGRRPRTCRGCSSRSSTPTSTPRR